MVPEASLSSVVAVIIQVPSKICNRQPDAHQIGGPVSGEVSLTQTTVQLTPRPLNSFRGTEAMPFRSIQDGTSCSAPAPTCQTIPLVLPEVMTEF